MQNLLDFETANSSLGKPLNVANNKSATELENRKAESNSVAYFDLLPVAHELKVPKSTVINFFYKKKTIKFYFEKLRKSSNTPESSSQQLSQERSHTKIS